MPYLVVVACWGVLTAIFPWVFSSQFVIFGIPVSIRSLGDFNGGLLIVFGVAFTLSTSLRNRMRLLADDLEKLSPFRFASLVFGLTLLFAVGALSHKMRAHYTLSTHAYDLGFFSNICWNTVHGRWFYCSLLERNFMGVHVNWILWPIAQLYRWGGDARWLLLAQVVFMTAAIPIFVSIVRRLTLSRTFSLVAALLFVCSPYFLHTLFNDFHPDTWQLPLLMGALWAFHTERRIFLIILAFCALLAKEDVSVILCGFALFLMGHKNWRLTSAALLFVGLSIFIFHTKYFIPKYLDQATESLLLTRYGLGDSFKDILCNLLFRPSLLTKRLLSEPVKYWRFLNYFFPVGGLTFLAPVYVVPCLISVLPHVLAQASTQLSLADIYALPSQPFVMVGGVIGGLKIWNSKKVSQHKHIWVAAFFVIAGLGVLNAPRTFRNLLPNRRVSFEKLNALIPTNASVVAQQNLLPHFDTRRVIQIFPMGVGMPELQYRLLENPEYVICDRIGNALPFDEFILRKAIENMEINTAYEKIFDENYFLVFRRRTQEELKWRVL